MVRLDAERCREFGGLLPSETLDYMSRVGVPEEVVFRGLTFTFDLGLQPMIGGTVFRVGDIAHMKSHWTGTGLERGTGHFGCLPPDGKGPLSFLNSSLAQFIECCAALDRLWELERTKQVEWEVRGDLLEREVRRIDPIVLDDPDGAWAFLIEELKAGVV